MSVVVHASRNWTGRASKVTRLMLRWGERYHTRLSRRDAEAAIDLLEGGASREEVIADGRSNVATAVSIAISDNIAMRASKKKTKRAAPPKDPEPVEPKDEETDDETDDDDDDDDEKPQRSMPARKKTMKKKATARTFTAPHGTLTILSADATQRVPVGWDAPPEDPPQSFRERAHNAAMATQLELAREGRR